MRFIHTADWQIGKVFRFVDDATMAVLQDARLDAIDTIGRLAVEHRAVAVLVAGDVYDQQAPSDRILLQPLERMRQFPALEWHLLPGNHDHHRPNGLWDRLQRGGLPGNVLLHLRPEPAPLAGGAGAVLPAPLELRRSLSDPTAWMDGAGTADGAIRVGLAHGSVHGFGSDAGATPNLIATDRPARARLDYLALGDWHGWQQIGPRCCYSGTPETDRFGGGEDSGHALLVDVAGPGAAPQVTPLTIGRFRWLTERATLDGAEAIAALEERLRALVPEPSRLLLDLTVEGALSLAERRRFEERIAGAVGAAFRWLRLDAGRLVSRPTTEDLDAIDLGGFVRTAADRLRARAENPADPERDHAARALERLYILHLAGTASDGAAPRSRS